MMTCTPSRWVWRNCLALLLMLVGSFPVLAGVKVMVEVDHPGEEGFVVVCRWYGASLNLIHGAPLTRLKERPFLAKAGEIVDCGWTAWSLWPGSVVTARVHHPVYVGSSGDKTDLAKVKDASGREVEVIVVRPWTYQAWIDAVVMRYAEMGELTDSGRFRFSMALGERVYALLRNFAGEYFRYHLESTGHPPDMHEYRAKYERRMFDIVEYAADHYRRIEGRKDKNEYLEEPEEAMEKWWMILERRVK